MWFGAYCSARNVTASSPPTMLLREQGHRRALPANPAHGGRACAAERRVRVHSRPLAGIRKIEADQGPIRSPEPFSRNCYRSTLRWFLTANTPDTPFAWMLAIFLSPSLAATPSSVTSPLLTMM